MLLSTPVLPFNAIASLLVLPSITLHQWKKPWGLEIDEGFIRGVPVVATDAVNASAGKLVQDVINGQIVMD
jgi:glycosyltransferase involved in cell wall biosynthesis